MAVGPVGSATSSGYSTSQSIAPQHSRPGSTVIASANMLARLPPMPAAFGSARMPLPLEHASTGRRYSVARGVVAFLLFLLPKPSDEAEQRQQMVPRALRSSRFFLGS
jgi:hypothetical protein